MGLHNTVAQALAAQALLVTGVVGSSSTPVDDIAQTPFAVVGPPKGQLPQPGSWERLYLTYPISFYIARTDTLAKDAALANDFMDSALATFQLGITLSGNVTEAVIKSWDTNLTDELAGASYLTPTIYIGVEVERSRTYTA